MKSKIQPICDFDLNLLMTELDDTPFTEVRDKIKHMARENLKLKSANKELSQNLKFT